MPQRIFTFMAVVAAVVLSLFSTLYAGEKPEIVRHDATYLDRGVSIVVQWQSANPVTRVVISAGREQKEIKVDEYDNRRNAYGYSGEVSALIPIEAAGGFGQPAAPFQYTVQIEDDLRLRSDVATAKVAPPAVAAGSTPQPSPFGMMPPPYGAPPPQGDDGWGQSHLNSNVTTQQQQPGTAGAAGTGNGIVDKLLSTMERHDVPPTLNNIKVNILSPETVSFSSKAIDDKGLREIKFRILDSKGIQVQEQVLSNLGKNWEGTTQTFQIGGGSFRVIAQAFDTAGNTSKEQSESFTLTGPPAAVQPQPPAQYPAQPADPLQPQTSTVPPPQPGMMPPPQPEMMPPPQPGVMPPPQPEMMPPPQPPPVVVPPPPVVVPPPPVVVPPPPEVVPPPPEVVPPPAVVVPPPPVATCPYGLVMCGNNCIDLQANLQNCGRCGLVCPTGYSCVAGVCKPPQPQPVTPPPPAACSAGIVMCGSNCVDLRTDTRNCGRCGIVCPSGNSCANSVCVSPPVTSSGISGQWNSNEGLITFTQTGTSVAALYSQDNGHITGTFFNNILDGYWYENSSDQRCSVAQTNKDGQSTFYWGRIKFQFNNDTFTGTWGYCDSNSGHTWNGSRIK